MFLGRFPLGEVINLSILTVDNNKAPAAPDACPTGMITISGGAMAKGFDYTALDKRVETGMFKRKIILDNDFSAGNYTVLSVWMISSTAYARLDTFEVLNAGHIDGAIVGLHEMDLRSHRFLVAVARSGKVFRVRNPRSV